LFVLRKAFTLSPTTTLITRTRSDNVDPSTLKYARTHEWVHVDGDVATVGISDFAVKELTDLVYIDLPAVGKAVKPGENFGEVESVKAVSDLYAPVAGEVVEVNEALPDSLQLLSDDPFGKGWIARIRLAEGASLDHLMDQAAYQKHCQDESH
jgi:glycine cleavage system H protein